MRDFRRIETEAFVARHRDEDYISGPHIIGTRTRYSTCVRDGWLTVHCQVEPWISSS